MSDVKDKVHLRRTADSLSHALAQRIVGTTIHCRADIPCHRTNSDGWECELGQLGRGSLRLQLWLDNWPNAQGRRYWYGFYSPHPSLLHQVISHLPKSLQPAREMSTKDMEQVRKETWILRVALTRGEFNKPIYEHYYGRYCYFGMYDSTPPTDVRGVRLLVAQAAAFFEEVARSMPDVRPVSDEDMVYSTSENRTVVRRHLARERSPILAQMCKSRDQYRCQVCGITFAQVYGALARDFAEAHHVIPLSQLKGRILHTADDLITVCANCHRVLHCRMTGDPADVARLTQIVRHRREAPDR